MLTDEELQARRQRLEQKSHRAAILREFVKHPGFTILKDMIEDKITDGKHLWLRAETPEKCWEIKLKIQPWQEVYDLITKQILTGDVADLAVRNEKGDSE